MNFLKNITLFIILLFVTGFHAIAAGNPINRDSLYNRIEHAVKNKILLRQQQNEIRKQKGLLPDYIIYVTPNDWQNEESTYSFPNHVLPLLQNNTNPADAEQIWNFNANQYLQPIPQKLLDFSQQQGYDYYLVICAIYNYFNLDESTDFTNIKWDSLDNLKSGKVLSSAGKDEGGGYANLLYYLINKFKKDGSLNKSGSTSFIYHFVLTTFVPYISGDNSSQEIRAGKLRHFQGLYWSPPNADTAFNAVWQTFYQSKQAELAGANTSTGKPATKEQWLATFINANQTMLAAIRNTNPAQLIAITNADTMLQQLQNIPDAVLAGFSSDLRIHILQVLSGIDMADAAEQKVCALIEQTPAQQADDVIAAMHNANPFVPKQVWQAILSTHDNGHGGTWTDNYKTGWCLLQCLTEETNDKILGIWGGNNYQRLIKALCTLSYESNGFKQKVEQLNKGYLNASNDNIPDRVILYTYNSMWSKVASTFVNWQYISDIKVDWNTSYLDNCQLETEQQLFLSYFAPNSTVKKLQLDPFEPIVFETNADLGLLSELNATLPTNHIVPAIIMKYANDKANNQTLTDATMAAIDVASLASGYGELQLGVTGVRKAWVLFDMANAGINLTVNTAAYDNPKIKELLGYYNMATGAVALTGMTVRATGSLRTYYSSLKAQQTAMSAASIRSFLKSVTDNADNIKNLTSEDAAAINNYLQRLKKEANIRGLSNLEQSTDDALAVMKAGGKIWRTASEMRDDVMAWAKEYRSKLPSNSQIQDFNKACVASYKKTDGTIGIVFGRNGGVLNTQKAYPTISAEKGLELNPELAKRLPKNTMWPNTANCAECDAVNQALQDGAKWEDIQIHTIDIRPDGTMTDVIQCSECQDIFKGMYVTSQ